MEPGKGENWGLNIAERHKRFQNPCKNVRKEFRPRCGEGGWNSGGKRKNLFDRERGIERGRGSQRNALSGNTLTERKYKKGGKRTSINAGKSGFGPLVGWKKLIKGNRFAADKVL